MSNLGSPTPGPAKQPVQSGFRHFGGKENGNIPFGGKDDDNLSFQGLGLGLNDVFDEGLGQAFMPDFITNPLQGDGFHTMEALPVLPTYRRSFGPDPNYRPDLGYLRGHTSGFRAINTINSNANSSGTGTGGGGAGATEAAGSNGGMTIYGPIMATGGPVSFPEMDDDEEYGLDM